MLVFQSAWTCVCICAVVAFASHAFFEDWDNANFSPNALADRVSTGQHDYKDENTRCFRTTSPPSPATNTNVQSLLVLLVKGR